MLLTQSNETITLEFKGRKFFTQSPDSPFIFALKSSYDYKSTHGTFSVKEKITTRIPLTVVKILNNDNDRAKLSFSGGGVTLNADFTLIDDAIKIGFQASENYGYEFRLNADANEGIFGGGEQYRQLNLKGECVTNFVSEHIKVKPIVQKTIFKFIPYKPKKHSQIETYSPMSTFVSSKLYAIRVDANSYGVQDFTNKNQTILRYERCPKVMLFVVEDSYKAIGMRLAEDIKINEYLPDWAYNGMILGVQGGIDRAVLKAEQMLDSGAAICGVWCQDWSGKKVTAVGKQVYWNWEVDNSLYPNLKNRIEALKAKGVHFLAYINPYLVKDGLMYNYCKERGYLIKTKTGEIYHIKSTTFDAGMMDLTNPDMVSYLKNVIIKQNMLDLGIDGYMADFGEYLPVDCVLFDGEPKTLHNYWPVLWAKINREAVNEHERSKDIFFFTRSGYNGVQKYTTIMWNGDQHTDFSVDYGMPCIMPATFNLGFSGLTATHSDVGGFISFSSLCRDEEVFVRWMEMNSFSLLMRSHETIRPEANAQYDTPITTPFTVKLSNVHRIIAPYLKACMNDAINGIPAIRPDFYNDNDFGLHKDLYSYLLGDDLFVAPVIERGTKTRKVNLPKGKWIHIFTGKEYDSGLYVIDAPLGLPCVFYRKDSKYSDIFESVKAVKA